MTVSLTAAEVRKLNGWIVSNPDDCREYGVEDIAKRFYISDEDAQYVYDRIHTNNGYIQMPETRFEEWALNKDPAELGRLLKEYLGESGHGGWEGFSSRDLAGIRKFVNDLQRYFDMSDPNHFRDTRSNLNPL